jgi:hypothetical protein
VAKIKVETRRNGGRNKDRVLFLNLVKIFVSIAAQGFSKNYYYNFLFPWGESYLVGHIATSHVTSVAEPERHGSRIIFTVVAGAASNLLILNFSLKKPKDRSRSQSRGSAT